MILHIKPWQPQKRDPDEAFFYGDGSEFDGVGFPDNSYDPDYKQWKVDYPTKSKRGRYDCKYFITSLTTYITGTFLELYEFF